MDIEAREATGSVKLNRDHIHPASRVIAPRIPQLRVGLQISFYQLPQTPLFSRADRLFGRRTVTAAPGSHLDKAEAFFVPSDGIQFAVFAAPVPRNNLVALRFQSSRSQPFARIAQPLAPLRIAHIITTIILRRIKVEYRQGCTGFFIEKVGS
jgi:hypothetical protein